MAKKSYEIKNGGSTIVDKEKNKADKKIENKPVVKTEVKENVS